MCGGEEDTRLKARIGASWVSFMTCIASRA